MTLVAHTEHEQDLALAAELQAALLPKQCPSDCPHQVAAARNRMCATIGGDFHDFIRINRDQTAILVGDVVGHGVRSSLLMAQIMGWLRSEPAHRSRPAQVVGELNRMLIDLGERTDSILPCTLFYAVLDLPSGIAFFVNAGHPKPLLCDANKGTVLPLGDNNLLLGVDAFEPEEGCHTFQPGQRLVLYTDGITDAMNVQGDFFGSHRLRELIHATIRETPSRCSDLVFQAIDTHRATAPQQDDETLVVLDRLKAPAISP